MSTTQAHYSLMLGSIKMHLLEPEPDASGKYHTVCHRTWTKQPLYRESLPDLTRCVSCFRKAGIPAQSGEWIWE